MKVLIIGGTGFLSPTIVNDLISRDHKVTVNFQNHKKKPKPFIKWDLIATQNTINSSKH
jgi:putative NADH-flavin reductase